MLYLAPGTPIKLPSGRTGTVITPPGNPTMPNHALIALDAPVHGHSDRQWFLAQLCQPIASDPLRNEATKQAP